MIEEYMALSIVSPSGQRIAQGVKTLEIRSWLPPYLPFKNLLIVENKNFLKNDGDEDMGLAIALVDIESAHPWRKDELEAATASYWADGYYAWVIKNVRPLESPVEISAKRKIYSVRIDIAR